MQRMTRISFLPAVAVCALLLPLTLSAAIGVAADPPTFTANGPFPWVKVYAHKPDSWFKSAEARQIAKNVLANQAPQGSFPKDKDSGKVIPKWTNNPKILFRKSTYDNSATIGELRFLARMYTVTKQPEYRYAFYKGLAGILAAQYPNGGWSQSFPVEKGYGKFITYNDIAMVNLMYFVRDVARAKAFTFVTPETWCYLDDDSFAALKKDGVPEAEMKKLEEQECYLASRDKFLDMLKPHMDSKVFAKFKDDLLKRAKKVEVTREAAGKAFDKAVECTLRCQIKTKHPKTGKEWLTAWCQQHDEKTLEPRPARPFEPASICGFESFGIIELLMTIDKPTPEIIKSVNSACEWLDDPATKIVGYKYIKAEGKLVKDPNARPLWARYYEIETNRPIFCGRDAVIKYDMQDLLIERRTIYSWYHTGGDKVLEKWAAWKKKHGIKS